MKNRLYGYICIFVLLEIIPPICSAKVINDAYSFRTKRNISGFEIPQPKENANYVKDLWKVNPKIEEKGNNDFEKGDTHLKEKHKISKRSANFINTDFQRSNAEKPISYDNVIAVSHLDTQRLNDESDYAGEANKEMTKQECDKDEETSNLRLARDVNANLDKYTDQNERSSLYDDYEAKDVAKRGVLGSPEDYEEAEDDSPGMEDVAAVQEQGSTINEVDKREMQNDARVKRDQAIADKSKSISDNPARSVQSKIASEDSYLREVSPVESLRSFNEASASNDALSSKIKESGLNEAISKANGAAKIAEPANIITSSKEDEANAKYEKRVEEEIQRKIDSIKEEIRRDIEAQQRVQGIEKNNARFDELQNQEDEDEVRSFENEPVEKRQTVAKRSVRDIADVARSKRYGKKQPSKKQQQRKKVQPTRAKKIDKSDISKKSKNLKRRSVANHDESSGQTPLKGLSKKKRERIRQTFLVSNEQAKKRRSISHALSSDPTSAKRENTLFMDQDSNSHLYTDSKMLQAPLSVASEDENNEEEQSPAAAAHTNSLAFLTGSSQELNPRLAKEYKEAFGGLQSEPGSALVRFKRIKRVLGSPETEKI